MNQALHIFKKDVGHLRYNIGITLLAAAVFCFMRNPVILPAAWWFLIPKVIHEEPLPGTRQFWRTRPYEWKSLLGAKSLFVVTFVNLPLLLADALIVHAEGFSVLQEWAGLLWTQVLLISAIILPIAAFSAMTSGLIEMLTLTLFLILGFLAWIFISPLVHSGYNWMELEWIKTYVLVAQVAAAATVILLWQYARRNTFATRMVAAAAALLVPFSSALFPWPAAFALQAQLSPRRIDASFFRITLDWDRKWLGRIYASGQDEMTADLPLRFSGLPAGTEVKLNGLTMTLDAPDGKTWIVKQPPPSSFDMEEGIPSLRAVIGRESYMKLRGQPLQIRGTLYFTLYGNKRSTFLPLNGIRIPVKGIGVCSGGARFLRCASAFRQQSDSVGLQIMEDSRTGPKATTEKSSFVASYSPFPADLNIDPLYPLFSPRLGKIFEVRVDTFDTLAHLQRNFEINNVRLDDFAGSHSSSH